MSLESTYALLGGLILIIGIGIGQSMIASKDVCYKPTFKHTDSTWHKVQCPWRDND